MAVERLYVRARPLASPLRVSGATRWQQQQQRPASTDSKKPKAKNAAKKEDSSANTAASPSPPASASPATQNSDSRLEATFSESEGLSVDKVAGFNPLSRAKRQLRRLPSNRYEFRAPRYYRGPLHPVQPPPPSDPASREFRPGPFSLPRMEQQYHTTVAADLMTVYYDHVPPGTPKLPPKERLREWSGDSPFHKNRPLRPPRGDPTGRLGLLRKQINWWNLPKLERITVSAVIPRGASDSAHVHAAGMVIQAITGARARITKARRATSQASSFQGKSWIQKKNKPISATADLYGEDMWHFLSTLVSVVMPKIKEFTGVRGRSGDTNGNLNIGLQPDLVGSWPEIAVNYDMYPPEMIPGIGVTLHSTARSDRDMRLLFAGLGIPFKGNHRTREV